MAFIKGEALLIYAGGKSIAQATSSQLQIGASTREISTKDINGGKWQHEEVAILNWSMSSDNLLADSYDGIGYSELVDLMLSRTQVDVVFGLESTSSNYDEGKVALVPHGGWAVPKKGYKGKAIITAIDLTAANGEFSTYTVTLQGVGELIKIAAIDATCTSTSDTTKHPTTSK